MAVATTVTVVVGGSVARTTELEANDFVMKMEVSDVDGKGSDSSARDVVAMGSVNEDEVVRPEFSPSPVAEGASDCAAPEVSVTVTVKVKPEPSFTSVVVLLKSSAEVVLSAPTPPVASLEEGGRRAPNMPPAVLLSTQSRRTPGAFSKGIAKQSVPVGQDIML